MIRLGDENAPQKVEDAGKLHVVTFNPEVVEVYKPDESDPTIAVRLPHRSRGRHVKWFNLEPDDWQLIIESLIASGHVVLPNKDTNK